MAGEVLSFERHHNYAVVTLNRPEKRNALNEALLKALDEALVAVEHDKEIRALIIRGNGASFCSGLDLAEADRLEGGHSPVGIERVFRRLENVSVPTIAAVQGPAASWRSIAICGSRPKTCGWV
jgi:enoyl-CoA hydratase/carnithine racemase